MDEIAKKRLERKLSPEHINANLQLASMYLVAYELLRSAIVDQVRSFYSKGFGDGKLLYDEDAYQAEVLSRHKKVFEASCLWLQDHGVFEGPGVAELQRMREHRDRLAHELPSLMVDPEFEVDLSLLVQAQHHLLLVDRFWGAIAADLNEIPPDEVDYDGIRSMSSLLLDHIMTIVSGASA